MISADIRADGAVFDGRDIGYVLWTNRGKNKRAGSENLAGLLAAFR